jgi:hypothetical protein
MGFIVFTMFAWPFIDGWLRRNGRARPACGSASAARCAIIGLTVWEAAVAH